MVEFKTKIEYITDGSTDTYLFNPPFEVQLPGDVDVYINGAQKLKNDLTYPWDVDSESNPTSVVFTSAPAAGLTLRISRSTDRDSVYKTFTNEPLNANDLTNSFKKILFIEQEGYDDFNEAEELFSNTGSVPSPGPGEEDNTFLASLGGVWETRSVAQVKDILGLGNTSQLDVGNVLADSVSATSVSAVSATLENVELSTVIGGFIIQDDGQDYSRLQVLNNNPLYLKGAEFIFKIDDSEVFRIENQLYPVLHTYGDSIPTSLPAANVPLALSGTGKVVASNTTKGWGTVRNTATTPTLSDTFGVSAVTDLGTGTFKLDLDTDVLVAADTYIIIPSLYTQPNGAYSIGITSRTSSYFVVSVWQDSLGSTLTDVDFQFQIF